MIKEAAPPFSCVPSDGTPPPSRPTQPAGASCISRPPTAICLMGWNTGTECDQRSYERTNPFDRSPHVLQSTSMKGWHGATLRGMLAILGFAWGPQGFADDADKMAFFEKRIRPVLVEKCYECHSAKVNEPEGGLRLDSREGVRKGGNSGPAIVPGDSGKSLILSALRHESIEMPPDAKLPDSIVQDFATWIESGAVDPREPDAAEATRAAAIDIQAARGRWPFAPPVALPLPAVVHKAWPNGLADVLLLAALENRDLAPSDDADASTLIRRVVLDLVGIPPSRHEIEAFLAEPSPDAIERLVDRCLASPRFGERWGRHWLDVARYAESSGGGRAVLFPNAWRYRDYIIDAFNRDLPYDQFLREQIAGDLLPTGEWREDARRITGLGFLALGPKNLDTQDKELLRMDVVDEQLDVIGQALLGMTLGCARCHDHKFDPIPTRDYYAMAGILRSTKTLLPGNVSGFVERRLPVDPSHAGVLAAFEGQRKQLEADLNAARKKRSVQDTLGNLGDLALSERIQTLEADLKQLDRSAPQPAPVVNAVLEEDQAGDCPLMIRGNVHLLGDPVPRGFLSVVSAATPSMAAGASGRLELAEWLSSKDNPLTARVMVNRIWRHLFGRGIVPTPDNFGTRGDPPSHPELLDALAVAFMAEGWSTKRLIRDLVASRAYRLSRQCSPDVSAADPENRCFGRYDQCRLEVEVIRDAMLHAAGSIDLSYGGPSLRDGATSELEYRFDGSRRTVYIPVLRAALFDMFEVFDFADPNIVVGSRTRTILPTQSLFFLNSPFAIEQSRLAAERLLSEPGLTDEQRIQRAFWETLTRPPLDRERAAALDHLAKTRDSHSRVDSWAGLFQAIFASIDFRYKG